VHPIRHTPATLAHRTRHDQAGPQTVALGQHQARGNFCCASRRISSRIARRWRASSRMWLPQVAPTSRQPDGGLPVRRTRSSILRLPQGPGVKHHSAAGARNVGPIAQ
jgi:hypothetical protein